MGNTNAKAVRAHLISGGAVASAGILALSLVVVPPDTSGAGTDVRAVHLAAFTLPPPAPAGALLQKFISNQSQVLTAGIPVTPAPIFVRVVQPSGTPTQPILATAESRIDPAISNQAVNNTALAAPIDPTQILSFILAAGFVVLFVALIPVGLLFGFIGYNVIDPILAVLRDLGVLPELDAAGASTATVEALAADDSLLSNSAPVKQNSDLDQVFSAPGATLKRISRDIADGVSQVLTATGSPLPAPPAVAEDFEASRRNVGRHVEAIRDRIDENIGAVKSVVGNGRTIVRSADSEDGAHPATTGPARKTPVRDAVRNVSSDLNKAVTKVSDNVKKALGGARDNKTEDGGSDGAEQ